MPTPVLNAAIQMAYACLMTGAYVAVFPLGAIATHIVPSEHGRMAIHLVSLRLVLEWRNLESVW